MMYKVICSTDTISHFYAIIFMFQIIIKTFGKFNKSSWLNHIQLFYYEADLSISFFFMFGFDKLFYPEQVLFI